MGREIHPLKLFFMPGALRCSVLLRFLGARGRLTGQYCFLSGSRRRPENAIGLIYSTAGALCESGEGVVFILMNDVFFGVDFGE